MPGRCSDVFCLYLQAIDEKGYQQELPDIWLSNGNPWEIARPDITFKIGFYGSVDNFKWSPGETVSHDLGIYMHPPSRLTSSATHQASDKCSASH